MRGLQKMVEEDRYCPDIITQVASVPGSAPRRSPKPDAQSSPSLRRQSPTQPQKSRIRAMLRRTTRNDLRASALMSHDLSRRAESAEPCGSFLNRSNRDDRRAGAQSTMPVRNVRKGIPLGQRPHLRNDRRPPSSRRKNRPRRPNLLFLLS